MSKPERCYAQVPGDIADRSEELALDFALTVVDSLCDERGYTLVSREPVEVLTRAWIKANRLFPDEDRPDPECDIYWFEAVKNEAA